MKQHFSLALILIYSVAFSQSVFLSKIERSHENSDKSFYRISDTENAEYLGELEIQNFQGKEEMAFAQIYTKAKQIGANAFLPESQTGIAGEVKDFNPAHYFLSLYYTDFSKKKTDEKNVAYIFSSSREQTVRVNDADVKFLPYTYIRKALNVGDEINISTKKFLGSNVKMKISEDMPVQYFQISGSKIKSATDFSGGLIFKTGDVLKLDRSYGDFLRTVYKEIN